MFAKVENGVRQNRAKIFAGKTGIKRNFGLRCFPRFFEQDRFLFARVEIGVTEFPTKRPKRKIFCV